MGYIFLAVYLLIPFALYQTQEVDPFPPLWESAPGTLEDYPRRGNTIFVNAWKYTERLGLYKILLSTSAKYFAGFGPNNEGNILWGLPLYYAWQYRTGRLADPTNATRCGHRDGDYLCVSVFSWFPCMNYYLAVIPFFGALDSGFLGQLPYEVEMLPPGHHGADFCHTTAKCKTQAPKVMASWNDFFKYLLSTAPHSGSSATPHFSRDEALNYMWKAHTQSTVFASSKFYNRLTYLSGPESSFAKDWVTAVDFIGATRFSTDQNTTNRFLVVLPPRMLLEGDKAPFIADLSSKQNQMLFHLGALRKTNEATGGLTLLLWQTAMSTEEGRKAGRNFLESLL